MNRFSRVDASCGLQAPAMMWVRAGSNYGQTLREAFGPMKVCPLSLHTRGRSPKDVVFKRV